MRHRGGKIEEGRMEVRQGDLKQREVKTEKGMVEREEGRGGRVIGEAV